MMIFSWPNPITRAIRDSPRRQPRNTSRPDENLLRTAGRDVISCPKPYSKPIDDRPSTTAHSRYRPPIPNRQPPRGRLLPNRQPQGPSPIVNRQSSIATRVAPNRQSSIVNPDEGRPPIVNRKSSIPPGFPNPEHPLQKLLRLVEGPLGGGVAEGSLRVWVDFHEQRVDPYRGGGPA